MNELENEEMSESQSDSEHNQKASLFNKLAEENKEEIPEDTPKKDTILIYSIAVLLVIVALVILIPKFIDSSAPRTLEELHQANIDGKLSEDKGFMYGVYSFVYFDNLWYTQLSTEKSLFNIPFHFSPLEVQDIKPVGFLNKTNLNNYINYYMTFDPLDENLQYIAVSIGESNGVFMKVLGKGVVAACTQNETDACSTRPIVDCETTKVPTFYYANEPETNLIYLNTCAIISGTKEELVRATDRMLYDILGII